MAITDKKETPEMIEVKSLVSGRTMEPFVEIVWGEQRAQLSLEEARNHALYILECADAAESDLFVFQWLTRDVVGTEADKQAEFQRVMREFQAFREARLKR
jgi:hypothetical protein